LTKICKRMFFLRPIEKRSDLFWRKKMAKRPKKTQKSQAKLQDFVIVAFAEDWEQARERETLLRNNDIPAIIKEQEEESTNAKGIAIMVPEDFLDEAHVVIESQDAYDDFYDLALEDEAEADFDSDLFEDSF
jgi:hypothetical protein